MINLYSYTVGCIVWQHNLYPNVHSAKRCYCLYYCCFTWTRRFRVQYSNNGHFRKFIQGNFLLSTSNVFHFRMTQRQLSRCTSLLRVSPPVLGFSIPQENDQTKVIKTTSSSPKKISFSPKKTRTSIV